MKNPPADPYRGSCIRGAALLAALAVAVGMAVLAVHWPVLSVQALSLDDTVYLFDNPVLQRPSRAAAVQVFREILGSSRVEGYYEPLTLVSLMIDVYRGGRPGRLQAFHTTSLALHVLNTMLVVVLLYGLLCHQPDKEGRADVPGGLMQASGRADAYPISRAGVIWAAAAVGLLFGLHPLTVEPVAWVWERKTLLASFFAFGCLILYVRYARRRGAMAYVTAMAAFGLSLLAKPTGTPLPVLLLLLDAWPLRRLTWRAVAEKTPFFIVAGVSAAITVISTGRSAGVTLPASHSLPEIPLKLCYLVTFYLGKIIWPARLSSLYALPEPMSLSQPAVLGAAVFTGAMILLLLVSLRWTRGLLTSWLFFVVALLPTMGIIGYSWVAASDKYVYLPAVGLLVPLTWLVARLWRGSSAKTGMPARRLAVLAVVAVLAASEVRATRRYLSCWRDTERFARYMVAVDPASPRPHGKLADELMEQGRLDEAIAEFDEVLRRKPDDAEAHNNRGLALARAGRMPEATREFIVALKLRPTFAEALTNLGNVLVSQGKDDEAVRYYEEALKHKPGYPEAHFNLANLLSRQGRLDEAVAHYRTALRVKPDWAEALNNLALALTEKGEIDAAVAAYAEALRVNPRRLPARFNLCDTLMAHGRFDEAIAQYAAMLKFEPDRPGAHLGYARALAARGRLEGAVAAYREVLRLDPTNAEAAAELQAAVRAAGTRRTE